MPTLPISFALREAAPEGVNDLYNKPVEGMEDSDIDRIIMDQRANRERYAQAEAAGGTKRTRKPKEVGVRAQFADPGAIPDEDI